MKRYFLILLPFLLLNFLACKKNDSGSKPISFDQLGDTRLNDITGFAMNGDVLGTVASQNGWDNLRYRAASNQWERIGANAAQPSGLRLVVLAEDAEGTYYSRSSSGDGIYELRTGSTAWTPLDYQDGDAFAPTSLATVIVNATGIVAVQVSRKSGNQNRSKVFLRSPGSAAWQIANSRPEDDGYLLQLTDQGDLFVETLNQLFVIQKGGNQLKPVLDCKGTVILPYCGFHGSIAANGDLLLYEGGIGSPKLYRVEATQTYPTTATYLYDQTGEIVTRQSTLLTNGTVMANGNDGSYGAEQYFFRGPGAGNWQHSPAFPGKGYVIVAANRQSEIYTTSRQFPASDGLVYRVNY